MTTSNASDAFAAGLLRWFENHATQGLFTTDCELRIRTWNRWMATASGLDGDDVIGRPLFEVLPSLVERSLDSDYLQALGGQSKILSHTLHRYLVPCPQADGTMMPQSGRIAPLIDDTAVVGTITLINDVSERVASEKQLRAQIAAAEEARLQVEAASRSKDEFLATLSHEIRTPLSAVLGWIHLLKVRDPDAATIKRAVDVIERNAKSQLTLISDMLDMARISSGKVRLELGEVNMTQVVSAALDAVRPAADTKNIKLVTDLPPGMAAVSGDADRLLQVTWNVLSNAVKFTGDGGMVVVSLRSDSTGTHLTVADTGQGIDPKFLSQVFERFKQADTSAGRRSGGLGLGLALVKDLVTMHGGTVEAASPGLGLGSTFSIHLPNRLDAADHSSARPALRPTETTLEGVRVLVVEDDPDAREIAERSITDAGGTTIGASNATEALAVLAHGGPATPHVLVSDIGLPGTDGYDLLEAIRRLPSERGALPAIAVTAYASEADATLARTRGFVAHITKPYSPSALVAAVREALDHRER
ncbi:MAG TPA: ATP-binding protein [Vicinamibacterales bacterium]|nr:ATP-binding protein [Vicinamibacterales bacterium]